MNIITLAVGRANRAISKAEMSDLKSLSMEALVKRAASQLGYPRIKPKQLEAVVKFCLGRDVFASLPTSYGKTLIYALLPSIFRGCRRQPLYCFHFAILLYGFMLR